MATRDREPEVLLGLGVAGLIVSGFSPKDRFTWFLEGALAAQLSLARLHDRELAALTEARAGGKG